MNMYMRMINKTFTKNKTKTIDNDFISKTSKTFKKNITISLILTKYQSCNKTLNKKKY